MATTSQNMQDILKELAEQNKIDTPSNALATNELNETIINKLKNSCLYAEELIYIMKEPTHIVKLFQLAEHSAIAKINLITCLLFNATRITNLELLKSNQEKAMKILKMLVEENNPNALFLYTFCLINGIMVKIDQKQAFELLQSGGNHPRVLNMLGHFYMEAIHVKRDVNLAYNYFRQSLELGEQESLISLGFCYKHGFSVKKDCARAFSLFQEGTKKCFSSGFFNLGQMYETGVVDSNFSLEKDLKKAFEYYQQGAAAENYECIIRLMRAYVWGNEIIQENSLKAIECGRKIMMHYPQLVGQIMDICEDILDHSCRLIKQKTSLTESQPDKLPIVKTLIDLALSLATGNPRAQILKSFLMFQEHTDPKNKILVLKELLALPKDKFTIKALSMLGMLLEENNDYKQAVECYQLAIAKAQNNYGINGVLDAMLALARCYEYGLGVEPCIDQAYAIYTSLEGTDIPEVNHALTRLQAQLHLVLSGPSNDRNVSNSNNPSNNGKPSNTGNSNDPGDRKRERETEVLGDKSSAALPSAAMVFKRDPTVNISDFSDYLDNHEMGLAHELGIFGEVDLDAAESFYLRAVEAEYFLATYDLERINNKKTELVHKPNVTNDNNETPVNISVNSIRDTLDKVDLKSSNELTSVSTGASENGEQNIQKGQRKQNEQEKDIATLLQELNVSFSTNPNYLEVLQAESRTSKAAELKLAVCLLNGVGLGITLAKRIEDEKRGVEILQKYITQRDPQAILIYASYLIVRDKDDDKKKAFELYSSIPDHPLIIWSLGRCYFSGYGVEKDEKMGYALFTKAQAMDDKVALIALAICFSTGAGVPQKNMAEAMRYYHAAKDKGIDTALFELAKIYENGYSDETIHIEKDIKTAMEYYRQAANNGLYKAQARLVELYSQGTVVEQNVSQAIYWAKRVLFCIYGAVQSFAVDLTNREYSIANKRKNKQTLSSEEETELKIIKLIVLLGVRHAHNAFVLHLARSYMTSLVCPVSRQKAKELLKSILSDANGKAYYFLGMCYRIEKKEIEAFHCYAKCVEINSPALGIMEYAILYCEEGRAGTAIDLDKALLYLNKALAHRGSEECMPYIYDHINRVIEKMEMERSLSNVLLLSQQPIIEMQFDPAPVINNQQLTQNVRNNAR